MMRRIVSASNPSAATMSRAVCTIRSTLSGGFREDWAARFSSLRSCRSIRRSTGIPRTLLDTNTVRR